MRRNQPKTDNLAKLRKRLGSVNSDMRYHAYLDAQNLSAEQLWELVLPWARQAHRSSRRLQATCISGLGLILLVSVASQIPYPLCYVPIAAPVGWLYWLSLYDETPHRPVFINLSRLMAHQQEARFVGPSLLMYANVKSPDVQASARQTLLRLLPLLDETHMQSWTAAQKAALLEIARHSWGDLELKFAALDALAQVGETDAVKVLRELAQMQTASVAELLYSEHLKRGTSLERQIDMMSRRAAGGGNVAFATRPTPFDCLPSKECEPYTATALYLQRKAQASLDSILERLERQRQTGLLLRSAEQPAFLQTQELLRPVREAGADVSGEQLLRPK